MNYSFVNDLQWSKTGELLATVALVKYKSGITYIDRPDYGCSNSSDIVWGEDIAAEARMDFKIDSYAYTSMNFCYEIISQLRPKHLLHLKEKPELYQRLSSIFKQKDYGASYGASLEILNSIQSQIVAGKELKRFTINERGWGIKDTEPTRSIGVFCYPGGRKVLDDSKNQAIIKKFFESICCIKQRIGPEQIDAMRKNHDKLFGKLGINGYRLYIINKNKLMGFFKDTKMTRAINVDNGTYQTLSFLIKFDLLEKNDWCSKFTWSLSEETGQKDSK